MVSAGMRLGSCICTQTLASPGPGVVRRSSTNISAKEFFFYLLSLVGTIRMELSTISVVCIFVSVAIKN